MTTENENAADTTPNGLIDRKVLSNSIENTAVVGEAFIASQQKLSDLRLSPKTINRRNANLMLAGGHANSGDITIHREFGEVMLMFSDDRNWHYLRRGYAGYGTDLQNLVHSTGVDTSQLKAIEAQEKETNVPFTASHRPVDVFNKSIYSGKVLSVADGVVTQKINRDGNTVRHDASKLSEAVQEGDVVDIKYGFGVGVVSGLDKGLAGVVR